MKKIVLSMCALLLLSCLISCGDTPPEKHTEHVWDDGVITIPAECGKDTEGVRTYTCTVCEATKEETFVSASARHSMEAEWHVTKAATCTENGEQIRACVNCGYVRKGEFNNLGGHLWDAGTVEGDQKVFQCLRCPETRSMCAMVYYADYGAVGDGVTDDYQAIYNAHVAANEFGLTVVADPNATYYLGVIDKTIPIRSNVDWGGAHFIIDDTTVPYYDNAHRGVNIFTVQATAASQSINPRANMKLTKGQTNLGMTFASAGLLCIQNSHKSDFIRYGVNADTGAARQEYIIVDKDGNVDPTTPIQYDYDAVTSITFYSLEETPITVDGGIFTTYAADPVKDAAAMEETYKGAYYYYNRGIRIERSYTTIQNVEHYIVDTYWEKNSSAFDTGVPYNGFYNLQTCVGVTVQNCVATGHREYKFLTDSGATNAMGSYDVSCNGAVNASFLHFRQSNSITDRENQHGLFGTNYCRNMYLDDCYVDRFDAHKALYNATIKNCTIGFNLYVIGGGTVTVENTTRLTGSSFIGLRDDYGSVFDGDVIIKNCTYSTNGGNVIGGTWRSFDAGLPCYMVRNLTIDNLSTKGTVYVFHINNLKSNLSPLTDATNPFHLPQSVTFRNMSELPLARSSCSDVITKNSVKVTVEK